MATIENDINIRDLGFANGWQPDSLEQRLVDMTGKAGYAFKEESHDPHGYDTVYVCREAGLKYHVCSN
ncbi:MAG: hypothetical protein IJ588_06290 [Prevotella sp.]|nr:hypothetical protein [Prevotella sp.]